MEQPYYSVLPKEARLQLLVEADYPTILELCQDPLFKDICNSEILWREKLRSEFGLNAIEDAKQEYLDNYSKKLEKIIEDKKLERNIKRDDISEELVNTLSSIVSFA